MKDPVAPTRPDYASGEVKWRRLVSAGSKPGILNVPAQLATAPSLVRSECRIASRSKIVFFRRTHDARTSRVALI